MTSRTYGQYCPVAHALDVVGERWTLLIARDLLLMGPRRFTDLQDALPGLGTGLLAQRLKQLEGHGLVSRERLPPPAASTAYVLTESGRRRLGPIVAALAAFGAESLGEPATEQDVDVDRFLRLAAASTAARDADAGGPAVELHVAGRVVHLSSGPGGVLPGEGPAPGGAAVVITLGAAHLPGLALARTSLTELIEAGLARAEGDPEAIAYAARLFASFSPSD